MPELFFWGVGACRLDTPRWAACDPKLRPSIPRRRGRTRLCPILSLDVKAGASFFPVNARLALLGATSIAPYIRNPFVSFSHSGDRLPPDRPHIQRPRAPAFSHRIADDERADSARRACAEGA